MAGDFNPLHVDRTHARGGHYGAPVAHAGLVASVAIGLGSMDAPLPATVGMMEMSWKYLQPVRVGDSIRSRWRLARKRPLDGKPWGVVVWQVEVENQDGAKVAEGQVTRMVARSGAAEQAAATPPAVGVAAEEPAEAASPAASRRRRRRGGRGGGGGQVTETVFTEPTPDPETADVPSPARRSRRRRGRGGGGNGSGPAPAAEPAPAPIAQPAARAAAPSARGGLGGVLRRLRGGG